MNESSKAKLRVSLIEVLEEWWSQEAESGDLPWVGSDAVAYITDAALAVVFSLQDTQDYLEREHALAGP